MALPTSAIDQIRRDSSRTPGWSSRLLMFSGTVLFVSVVAYAGLQFGYRPYLEKQIEAHELEMKKFSQEVPATKQAEIIQFYSQIANLKTLLGNHGQASRLFELLEQKTVGAVFYEKLTLNGTTREMQLSGKARTMQDLGAQIQIFQAEPMMKTVTAKTITADVSGVWNFDLSILLDPSLFGYAAENVTSTTVR